MKVSIKDIFSKYDQIWLNMKKALIENFIFYAMFENGIQVSTCFTDNFDYVFLY